jgi:beta-mannosidase
MSNPFNVQRTTLSDGWEVAERLPPGKDFFLMRGGEKMWIPARVPGHVHLDLVRAGVIGDPFWRMNEWGCRWVDEADWTYRTTFDIDSERLAAKAEHGRHFLHFHGLDTLCRVYLNSVQIGTAENFFIPHRFDVTDTLREGPNELRIEFDSALRVGRERAQVYLGDGKSERGSMSYFNFAPRAFVRKPQYTFGWDWGGELVSCGLWQPVELVTVPVAEIVDCSYRWHLEEQGAPATVTVSAVVERYDANQSFSITADIYDENAGSNAESAEVPTGAGQQTVELTLTAHGVHGWSLQPDHWSWGPFTYTLDLTLEDADDENQDVFEECSFPLGLRTVELVREPDADGSGEGMKFRVNGVDTYIKGANWIPEHSFPATISRERLQHRLIQAKEAGFNMLRVWGGGLYETEEFYDLCDELGILVWQDFPFACSMYPDDDPAFVEQVRQEAVAAVRRIRNHPCLALWCGGNENMELFQHRWAGPTQATKFFGDTLIHETLPAVLAEEDPNTPYLPNSPYGGDDCTSEDCGDSHYWNVWHSKKPGSTGDWVNYAESTTRFSSEFGFAAPAGPLAWDSCMAPEDKAVRSPVSRWHDKTRKGYETYLNFIAMHYPAPQTFADLIYYGQANQADALQFGVEHWRRIKGRCWGTLFWQFNDCWPTHSWAVVDSAGEPKAAYYTAKRFYAPVLLSLSRPHPITSGRRDVEVHLVNDTLEDVPGNITIQVLTFTGEEVHREVLHATAPANAASGALHPLTLPEGVDLTGCFIHAAFLAERDEIQAENFLLLEEPKNLRLPDPLLRWNLTYDPENETATITLSAERFAGYVYLRFDTLTAPPTFSDNWFHLAPGQTRTITVRDLPPHIDETTLSGLLRLRWL